jgi:hypothetical protein
MPVPRFSQTTLVRVAQPFLAVVPNSLTLFSIPPDAAWRAIRSLGMLERSPLAQRLPRLDEEKTRLPQKES